MLDNKNWWQPDNLKNAEAEIRKISNHEELDTRNDFGSYRKVLLTGDFKDSHLEEHNDLDPAAKIKAIHSILRNPDPQSILDAGCGMGFTTAALSKQYPKSTVLGVDISNDAVAFACEKHRDAKFRCVAISPTIPPIGEFDLIYCFEFYPFTRNSDAELQGRFIDFFSSQLRPGGKIVICQLWENVHSIASALPEIEKSLSHLKFDLHEIANPKLISIFPGWLAGSLNACLEMIQRKKISRTILVIQKKSDLQHTHT